ncbi:MAG: hypothetical protein V1720_06370 [bacterium]
MIIKKLLSVTLLILMTGVLYPQTVPSTYYLSEKKLSKISDLTPTSNSIIDILVANSAVWLGTSRGVSKTADDGESWINYYGNEAFGSDNVSAVGFYDGKIWAATAHSVEANGETLPEGTGLKYSTDNGETWQKIPQPIDEQDDTIVVYGINRIRALPVTVAINNLAYDVTFTPGTVWIATFAGGLRKTTDNGVTWQRVVLPPDYLDEIQPTDTLSFLLQPVAGAFGNESNLNHRIFSVLAIDDTTIYVGTAGGINKSTDGGISWKKFTHLNQDEPISGNFVVALGYDKVTKWIWAATWKAEGTSEYYAVSASSNGGETWQTFLPGEKAHNFGFKYIDSGFGMEYVHVFAPTDNGMFTSLNFGSTWVSIKPERDVITNASINTSTFYSAAVKKIDSDTYDAWFGSSDGLAKVRGDISDIYVASPTLKDKNETFAFPNPFSPDIKSVRIKYSCGDTVAPVTIRVFDFNMNLVKTIIQNVTKPESEYYYQEWDGRDEANKIVPNGVYFYRIDIGSDEPLFGKIMVLR